MYNYSLSLINGFISLVKLIYISLSNISILVANAYSKELLVL